MARACVLDASAAAAIVFREAAVERVLSAIQSMVRLVVPQVFALELANVGRSKVRQGEVTRAAAHELLQTTSLLPIDSRQVSWEQCWQVAMDSDLTIYDAAYLALALDEDLGLLTLDRKLQVAAGRRSMLKSH